MAARQQRNVAEPTSHRVAAAVCAIQASIFCDLHRATGCRQPAARRSIRPRVQLPAGAPMHPVDPGGIATDASANHFVDVCTARYRPEEAHRAGSDGSADRRTRVGNGLRWPPPPTSLLTEALPGSPPASVPRPAAAAPSNPRPELMLILSAHISSVARRAFGHYGRQLFFPSIRRNCREKGRRQRWQEDVSCREGFAESRAPLVGIEGSGLFKNGGCTV